MMKREEKRDNKSPGKLKQFELHGGRNEMKESAGALVEEGARVRRRETAARRYSRKEHLSKQPSLGRTLRR